MRHTRSWFGLGLLALVFVLGGLLSPADTAVTKASVSSTETTILVDPETSTPLAPGSDDVLLSNPSEEVACGQCPNRCWRDKDCDRICGSLGGACVQVNSCCRSCACYGMRDES